MRALRIPGIPIRFNCITRCPCLAIEGGTQTLGLYIINRSEFSLCVCGVVAFRLRKPLYFRLTQMCYKVPKKMKECHKLEG